MLRSTHLGFAAVATMLVLSGAASAQPNQTSAAMSTPPTEAASPMSSHRTPGVNAQQRVEEHIRQLRAQLKITQAEEPQWDRFANVMRQNARAMDQEFAHRMQQFPNMNALQNMQSYQQIAETHARGLKQLVPAFAQLYDTMPEQQKQLTDQVFRANAEAKAQRHMQTGSRMPLSAR